MKKLLFLAVAANALVLAGSANAADMRAPVNKAPPPVAAPLYNWSGFYLGANVGGGIANGDFFDQDCFSCADITFHKAFGEVGGQAGYNWQWGSAVLGIEGDLNWTDAKGSTSYEACCDSKGTTHFKFDAFGSIRARAGLALGPTLAYVTAGPAWGHFDSNTLVFGERLPDHGWHDGVAVGAGLEYMLAPNWTVRGEFLYLDFTDKTVPADHAPSLFHIHYAYTAEVARLGLNYRFDGGAPVPGIAAPAYVASLGGPSHKAPIYKAPMLSPAPGANWSGFYVGANIGGGIGDAKFLDPDCFIECANVTLHKGFAEVGGQAGYNWQSGATVLGIEGDLNWTSFNESSLRALNQVAGTASAKLDAFGSIRARAGLAVGPTLVYVTAGPAWGHFSWITTIGGINGPVRDTAPDDSWHLGIAAGAGLEVMVGPSWTIRGEYLVLDFTDRLVNLLPTPSGGSGDVLFRMNYAYTAQLARVGLNYKFDGGPAGAPVLGGDGWSAAPTGPVQNWSGPYAGVNAGAGMADSDNLDPDCSPISCADITFHRGFGEIGGQAGYNWQWGRTVVGIEGEFDWASVNKSGVSGSNPPGTTQFKFDAFGSIRARAGLAANRTLFYVTAGPAWGHFNSLTTIYNGSFTSPIRDLAPDDSWHVGVAAGAGVEFMVTPNWSIRGEYLYLGFTDALVHFQQVCCGSGDTKFRRSYGYRAEVARIGANYKFDWGGPVVAKY